MEEVGKHPVRLRGFYILCEVVQILTVNRLCQVVYLDTGLVYSSVCIY